MGRRRIVREGEESLGARGAEIGATGSVGRISRGVDVEGPLNGDVSRSGGADQVSDDRVGDEARGSAAPDSGERRGVVDVQRHRGGKTSAPKAHDKGIRTALYAKVVASAGDAMEDRFFHFSESSKIFHGLPQQDSFGPSGGGVRRGKTLQA